jgi:CelD/BcsL family acetyltransferase involved in cellulose biosynthesis
MDVSLCHPRDLADADIAAWSALRGADPRLDSPFLSLHFARCAGAVRDDARVLVVRGEGGAPHLFLPLQFSRSGLARPLGAPLCDVAGPIAAAGAADLLSRALGRTGLAAYAFAGWPAAPQAKGVKLRHTDASAVADLSNGFYAFLETQRAAHPKHFKKMRRLARQAENDHGPATITFGPASAEDLATLIGWKREQYARTRRHDVLGPDWTRALLDACAASHADDFAGVMATLRYDGKLAAAEFGLRSGATLHGWIAGYDPAFASCSPGLILQERLLEHAAASGVTRAVLGTGEGHYKKHYTSFAEPVDEGVVAAAGLAGGARALAAGLLLAVEQGRFGPASRLAVRTRRRMDVILAVETSMGGQVRGLARAIGGDRALGPATRAMKAGVRAASF